MPLSLSAASHGSISGGSLRNPAAWNNVFGFRPSHGRVPRGPVEDVFIEQFSTEGPMARSVEDLALLLSVQAGYDARFPLSLAGDGSEFAAPLGGRSFAGTKIGWLGDFGGYLPMEAGEHNCVAAVADGYSSRLILLYCYWRCFYA